MKIYKQPRSPEDVLLFKPRKNLFESKNVWFDPDICIAKSYNWWIFVSKINGKVVFNNYRYSSTTARHQRRVRKTLEMLGIKIDLEVTCHCSLEFFSTRGLDTINSLIDTLEQQIKNPRSNKIKNEERKIELGKLLATKKQAKTLGFGEQQ